MTYDMRMDFFIENWKMNGERDRYNLKRFKRLLPVPSCDTIDHDPIFCLKTSIYKDDAKRWWVRIFNISTTREERDNPEMLSIEEAVAYCEHIQKTGKRPDGHHE